MAEWLTIGLNGVLEAPRKFGCIGVHPTDQFAQAYGAASFYCPIKNGEVDDGNPVVLSSRGSVFNSDWNKQIDLTLGIKLPTDAINAELRLDAFNLFNFKSKLDFSEFGTDDEGNAIPTTYKTVTSYQNPRYLRAQLAVRF